MDSKALREQGGELIPQIRKMADTIDDEKRVFTAEEETRWEKLNGDYDALRERWEKLETEEKSAEGQRKSALERADELDRFNELSINDPAGLIGKRDMDGRTSGGDRADPEQESRDRTLAFNAYARAGRVGFDGLSDEMQQACERLKYNPQQIGHDFVLPSAERFSHAQHAYRMAHHSEARMRAEEAYGQRAMSALTGSAGAYSISPTFIQQLEINKLAFSSILQHAEIMRTARGEPLHWPTADDTSNTGEIVGESATIDGSTDFTLGQTIWNAYKFHAKMIKVPWELLEDSDFNIEGIIAEMLGQRLGRISNTRFTTGTGASQPKGITVGLTTGKTTASSTAIAADELLDLIDAIDDAYLNGASFMFNKAILLALRKLKDGQGQYLGQEGMRGGPRATIFSYPYAINNDMASTITSGDLTMLFGQLSAYKVRQVRGMRFIRLSERFAEFDQIAFDVFLRQDGHLLDAGTAPLKSMVQV